MQTQDTFKVEVYSGQGLEISEDATEVVVPGALGEVGFLAQHSQYVGNLGAGILQIFGLEHKLARRFVVSGGFARFSRDTLQVVADSVDHLDNINLESAKKDLIELEAKLSESSEFEPEYKELSAKVMRGRAIIELGQDYKAR